MAAALTDFNRVLPGLSDLSEFSVQTRRMIAVYGRSQNKKS